MKWRPVLLLVLWWGCMPAPRQEAITDLIHPLRLIAGKPDTLLIGDLFYSPDGTMDFGRHPFLHLSYLPEAGKLIIQAPDTTEGITLLPFTINNDTFHIPVIIERLQQHTFRYRPKVRPRQIHVMGSFNDWNRQSHRMADPDGDGTYELTIELEAGRYEYKFVVDGRDFADPANPDSVSNPFGSYNSVLTIQPRHPLRPFLHILANRTTGNRVTFSFYYQPVEHSTPLSPQAVVALLDNRRIPAQYISLSGQKIDLRLPKRLLTGQQVLRVAVSEGGHFTHFKWIFLTDGRPFNNTNHSFIWHDGILYSLMIDRFFDGDTTNNRPIVHERLSPKANYQGGDLAGILQKLKEGYFDSLGINMLWISPVNDNTDRAHPEWPPPHRLFSGYHGYWPVHHQRVEERFGDMALLQALIREAHRRGIRVLLDFIANHVHEDHPFYRQHPEWFGTVDLPDGRKNIRLWDEYRLTTWFEPFLPSFDYPGSRAALDTMTDNALWWLQQTGADGFRHDAVKHIPNTFWRTLTRKIRQWQARNEQARPIFQIGETFGSYDLVRSYVNRGQLDAQFNFNLYYTARYVFLTAEADFSVLRQELEKTFRTYGVHNLMGNLMDSHDQVRYMAFADGDLALDTPDAAEIGWTHPPQVDDPQSYKKAALYLTYLLTIPGLPTLYYGDEIGMTGAADPDNRRMMRFGKQLNARERAMLHTVRNLVKLRRRHPALRYGDFFVLHADRSLFAYVRSDPNERILVVLNKDSRPHVWTLELPPFYRVSELQDLLTGERLPVSAPRIPVRIGPIEQKIYQLNRTKTSGR